MEEGGETQELWSDPSTSSEGQSDVQFSLSASSSSSSDGGEEIHLPEDPAEDCISKSLPIIW